MVPQGPPAPLGGTQQVPPSLLRSNSGLLSGQAGSRNAFPSLASPHDNQCNNMNMVGNAPNISSLLQPSFINGGPMTGLSGSGPTRRGLVEGGAKPDPLSGVGSGSGSNPPSSSYATSSIIGNHNSSGQGQRQPQFSNPSGGQMLTNQQQSQLLDPQNFPQSQQQFSVPVKLEQQLNSDQTPQQMQALINLSQVKLEPQKLQSMRSLGPVKMESQDPSLFLQQQKQQQQQLLLSRQSPQASHLLHQQRLMQMQQQQQLLKAMPQQRSPVQSQIHPQNLPVRPPVKPVYEPGMCARRFTHYMYQQQHRPEDNNIEFWRKLVTEYFAPNAKKKWCISMYGSGRQTAGVLPQDVWHCEICSRKPGRGFEATAEVLPRLFKIKYESGTLEELLYVDMPKEYQNSSGQIVLDYAKAIQESVFEQLRVVRDGHLRIVFSHDLKICSWEFCARRHEELIPRRLLIPQVGQLGAAVQKCQANAQNSSSSDNSVSDLQNNCNMFLSSARQLAKALEVPLVNDLGYTKRYVRCLQISEVVNSMKDLIDYSSETGTGPMESLTKFPGRNNPSPGFQGHPQQTESQQQQSQALGQNSNHDNQAHTSNPQLATTNGTTNINNTMNSVMPTTSSTNVGLHQNSMNGRQQNPVNNIQMASPGSASTVPQTQPISHGSLTGNPINRVNLPNVSMQQQPALSGGEANVQKIIEEMLISSSPGNNGHGGMMSMGGMSGDAKNINGMLSVNNNSGINGSHMVLGSNGVANGSGFRSMSDGLGGQSASTVNGIRASLGSNLPSMNGRVNNMAIANQQHGLSNQLLSGLGAVNGFNNLQFDWKGSP